MKKIIILTCLTLATLAFTLTGTLHAEDTAQSRKEKLKQKLKDKGYDGSKVLEKYDTDKDGKLSDAEKAVMKADGIKKFDKNGDGKLDDEEKKAARDEIKAKMKEKQGASS